MTKQPSEPFYIVKNDLTSKMLLHCIALIKQNTSIQVDFGKLLSPSLFFISTFYLNPILVEVDKSCPHYGPQSVESVQHRFSSSPLAQQGWRQVANTMWQLFVRRPC